MVTDPAPKDNGRVLDPRCAVALVMSNPDGAVMRAEPISRVVSARCVRVTVKPRSVPAATAPGVTSAR